MLKEDKHIKEDYFEEAISFRNLYIGLKKSCRNVRWKDSVVGYESNALKNTYELRQDLLNGTYKIQPYEIFTIYEPKKREISATRIRDRQFQRSLCDNGLYQDVVEHFIRDNVACQVGRGTDDALQRFKVHMRRFYNKYKSDGWVLKCDIHHFFPETPHELAKEVIRKYISDKRVAAAVCDIVDSFGGDKGIGLGSQISQLIELLILNDMDHFIKEKLHIKYYIRYADDFILMDNNKEKLQVARLELIKWLDIHGLSLNKKTSLFPLKQGIIFLQWKFKYTDTGKILMLINKKKISKEKSRLNKLYKKGFRFHILQQSLNSWLSNARRGNTYKIQQMMIRFLETKKEVRCDVR